MIKRYFITGFLYTLLSAITNVALAQSKDYTIITFAQEDSIKVISNKTASIILERKPFSILYYDKRYDSNKEKYHAMKVAVLKDPADTLVLAVGKRTDSIPYFQPGSGMAAGGLYDAMIVSNEGHHYLYYENQAERRVGLVSIVNELLELEWAITGAFIDDQDVPLTELKVPALYFVFFADRNLDETIDTGELKIVKVEFR